MFEVPDVIVLSSWTIYRKILQIRLQPRTVIKYLMDKQHIKKKKKKKSCPTRTSSLTAVRQACFVVASSWPLSRLSDPILQITCWTAAEDTPHATDGFSACFALAQLQASLANGGVKKNVSLQPRHASWNEIVTCVCLADAMYWSNLHSVQLC